MKIETNLEIIKAKGEEREDENFRFRKFLKMVNMSSRKVDSLVHEINKRVTAQIDCTKCANCCKVFGTEFDSEDIINFAAGLHQEPIEFKKDYLLVSTENPGMYSLEITPCPFLKDNKCSNYDHRPRECASYPHLHKNEFQQRLYFVLGSYSICPIVYNVYEQLKDELGFRRRR